MRQRLVTAALDAATAPPGDEQGRAIDANVQGVAHLDPGLRHGGFRQGNLKLARHFGHASMLTGVKDSVKDSSLFAARQKPSV